VAGAVALLLPASAQAASVAVEDGAVVIRAGAGEANDVQLAVAGGAISVTDVTVPPTAGVGCASGDAAVTCGLSGIELVRVELDDGDDRLSIGAMGVRIEVDAGAGDDAVDASAATGVATLLGGDGRDALTGGRAADLLDGGEGNDLVAGGAGQDELRGGAGSDRLTGGAGADRIVGGGGVDTVSYAERKASVAVSLDGKANDGVKKERDRVGTDVENVTGGSGDDVIYGSEGRNVLAGGGGNDTMLGFGGADRLDGGDGHDILVGGPGNDQLRAGPGSDYCNVGPNGGTARDCERLG
jgi:Ca2+-binding RTX toxin-like protein